MSFKKMKLGQITDFHRGYDLPKDKQKQGNIPVIGSNGIVGYHDESKVSGPVVTVGRSGNIGNPRITYQDSWPLNTTLYISDFKGHNPEYIYYLLKTLQLERFVGGSAVPTLNRNHIKDLEVTVSETVDEEIMIANFLSLVDDKIKVNTQINKNLMDLNFACEEFWQ